LAVFILGNLPISFPGCRPSCRASAVQSRTGFVIHFLDFYDDFRLCPFTVVIFPGDLKHVGDVRQLQGKVIEIHGPVKEYDGRAEIILQEYRQLGGAGIRVPPLPKS
jgi:hypothetical protein